eukprot:jgi/Chlat1/5232/Chrsp33S05007
MSPQRHTISEWVQKLLDYDRQQHEDQPQAQACHQNSSNGFPTATLPPDGLHAVYGPDHALVDERSKAWISILNEFQSVYPELGDARVALARTPARVNLRGMHIDSHGGACNAIAIQRETIAAAWWGEDDDGDEVCVDNANKAHKRICFKLSDLVDQSEDQVVASLTGWARYVYATYLSLQRQLAATDRKGVIRGIKVLVASNIPEGAGLSSSAALDVTLLNLAAASNNMQVQLDNIINTSTLSFSSIAVYTACQLDPVEELELCRATERLAGASTGLGDPGAMKFARLGQVVHANFYEHDLDGILPSVRYAPFPIGYRMLIADTCCTRNLAGDAAVNYSLPRFASTLACGALQEAARELYGDAVANVLDRVARVCGAGLADLGGNVAVYKLFQHIPAHATVEDLASRWPALQATIQQATDTWIKRIPVDKRPSQVMLRGPTLFIVAECERSRRFHLLLKEAAHSHTTERRDLVLHEVGELMNVGHAGDLPDASFNVADTKLEELAHENRPLELVPGVFRASTKELDTLQSLLISAGALGASLTGAGMGGCVVALVAEDQLATCKAAIVKGYYLQRGLGSANAEQAITIAVPVQGAGFLQL